ASRWNALKLGAVIRQSTDRRRQIVTTRIDMLNDVVFPGGFTFGRRRREREDVAAPLAESGRRNVKAGRRQHPAWGDQHAHAPAPIDNPNIATPPSVGRHPAIVNDPDGAVWPREHRQRVFELVARRHDERRLETRFRLDRRTREERRLYGLRRRALPGLLRPRWNREGDDRRQQGHVGDHSMAHCAHRSLGRGKLGPYYPSGLVAGRVPAGGSMPHFTKPIARRQLLVGGGAAALGALAPASAVAAKLTAEEKANVAIVNA